MKSFEFNKLYARTSSGHINEWGIEASETGIITITEGLLEGAKTSTHRKCSPKNVGKMNETSAYEQARKEAESRIEKKKKQGYKSVNDLASKEDMQSFNEVPLTPNGLQAWLDMVLPIDRTDANNISKPMKAQPYFKVTTAGGIKTKTNIPLIKFPCFGQPKLNGFRCIVRWEEVEVGEGLFKEKTNRAVFRSKEGLVYDIFEHIESEFKEDMFKWNINGKPVELAYDGELYIPGKFLQEISSAARKRNSNTAKLKFYTFDLAVEGLKQDERLKILSEIESSKRDKNLQNIVFVKHIDTLDNTDAQNWTDHWIKEGYEGGIFRDTKALYQFGKRASTMVKLKRSQDKEFEIIDVVGGDNAPELGVFVCLAENGETFKATPEGSHEVKKEYLLNKSKYIGKPLTVRFFERTEDGKPFHAVGVAVRDYE